MVDFNHSACSFVVLEGGQVQQGPHSAILEEVLIL